MKNVTQLFVLLKGKNTISRDFFVNKTQHIVNLLCATCGQELPNQSDFAIFLALPDTLCYINLELKKQ